MLKKLSIKTEQEIDFVEITDHVKNLVKESGIESGLLQLFIPYDSVAVTMMGSDEDIVGDLKYEINKFDDGFGHIESSTSAAHFKSSLFGVDLTLVIDEGKLILGPTQGIFLTEFMGPAEREVILKFIKA